MSKFAVLCGVHGEQEFAECPVCYDELDARIEELRDALEHSGYDPNDCIDCGGPPHNEYCRFWKLRDKVPALFYAAKEEK